MPANLDKATFRKLYSAHRSFRRQHDDKRRTINAALDLGGDAPYVARFLMDSEWMSRGMARRVLWLRMAAEARLKGQPKVAHMLVHASKRDHSTFYALGI